VRLSLKEHHLQPYGDEAFFLHVVDTIRTHYATLLDFSTKGRAYFTDDFHMDAAAKDRLDAPGAREGLWELAGRLAASPDFSEASVETELRKLAEERGVKAGLLINASRAALTGQTVGPSVFAVFICIGRERLIERLGKV
jgi:glutamyl-tRNA synthetase